MYGSFSRVGLLVVVALVALLVQGSRMTPGGWIGTILRIVLGLLIGWLLVAVVWSSIAFFRRTR
jgi:hypothetical protein